MWCIHIINISVALSIIRIILSVSDTRLNRNAQYSWNPFLFMEIIHSCIQYPWITLTFFFCFLFFLFFTPFHFDFSIWNFHLLPDFIVLTQFSNIDEKHFEKIVKQPLPFDNTEYELRISGTVHTDQRIMTFVDHYWGFEVTGGIDQYEPLTILDVKGFIPVSFTSEWLYVCLCFFFRFVFFLARAPTFLFRHFISIH